MYLKGYEDNYVDFISAVGFGTIVVSVLVIYIIGFSIALIRSNRKKRYFKILDFITLRALLIFYLEFVKPLF